jgi:hypothetical protein
LEQRLDRVQRSLRQLQLIQRRPQTQRQRGLAAYVRIRGPERVATRFRHIEIVGYGVEMRHRPQPPQIFQRVIRQLFRQFLASRNAPHKIGFSFRILPHGDKFHVPLRSPLMNTYALLARELERHVQSDDPSMELRGLRVDMKLTAQWLPCRFFENFKTLYCQMYTPVITSICSRFRAPVMCKIAYRN